VTIVDAVVGEGTCFMAWCGAAPHEYQSACAPSEPTDPQWRITGGQAAPAPGPTGPEP